KQNWQAIFSDDGNITVRLPDGSTFSGPSWLKIVELLNSIDVDALQILAAQIHVDAQQVALDKTEVAQNKTVSESAATTATQKADAAAQSEASAAQS
ncbi:tail fiber domain-containing protein, partial [Enterobacter roggenkampii]